MYDNNRTEIFVSTKTGGSGQRRLYLVFPEKDGLLRGQSCEDLGRQRLPLYNAHPANTGHFSLGFHAPKFDNMPRAFI